MVHLFIYYYYYYYYYYIFIFFEGWYMANKYIYFLFIIFEGRYMAEKLHPWCISLFLLFYYILFIIIFIILEVDTWSKKLHANSSKKKKTYRNFKVHDIDALWVQWKMPLWTGTYMDCADAASRNPRTWRQSDSLSACVRESVFVLSEITLPFGRCPCASLWNQSMPNGDRGSRSEPLISEELLRNYTKLPAGLRRMWMRKNGIEKRIRHFKMRKQKWDKWLWWLTSAEKKIRGTRHVQQSYIIWLSKTIKREMYWRSNHLDFCLLI